MSPFKCPQCEKEVPSDVVGCPYCGYPIKAAYETRPEARTGFLRPSKPLGFLIVAIGLLFGVVSFVMFMDNKTDSGIIYAAIAFILIVWGGRAFKGLLPR